LTKQGLIEDLFNQFNDYLRDRGYEAEEGQIVDATKSTGFQTKKSPKRE
jgi:hypothetical protein